MTARVIAKRMWGWHFGQHLVSTPSDFDMMGDKPTHPVLLDYLANFLIQNDWSLKALHREIVLSATYRQSAQTPSEATTSDEANKLLSHYPVQRLSAEQYRDALLTLSGSLAIELPGGRIIVAYYADRITQHQRYHMGAINLSISELR